MLRRLMRLINRDDLAVFDVKPRVGGVHLINGDDPAVSDVKNFSLIIEARIRLEGHVSTTFRRNFLLTIGD